MQLFTWENKIHICFVNCTEKKNGSITEIPKNGVFAFECQYKIDTTFHTYVLDILVHLFNSLSIYQAIYTSISSMMHLSTAYLS